MNVAKRFAGYLPVVVDCETEGLTQTDALLEIAATTLPLMMISCCGRILPSLSC